MIKFIEDREIDVITVGRAGIDLYPREPNRIMEQVQTYAKHVGGSSANIAVGLTHLGKKTGMISRVSDDALGRFVIQYLERKGIATEGVQIDDKGALNSLTMTEVKSPENCGVIMYRENCADLNLEAELIDERFIKQAKALVITGTALSKSPSREATFKAVELARKNGLVVFFDIDYRPYTWQSEEIASITYHMAAEKSHVIIGTREEFEVMECYTGIAALSDTEIAHKWLGKGADIVIIKHGENGSHAFTQDTEPVRHGIFPAKLKKTYGAGDAFASGFIYGMLENYTLVESLGIGSAAASINISGDTCTESMPRVEELKNLLDYIE